MKYEIEVYKNHQIFYNDDSDKFECTIDINDNIKSSKRASLNDMRKSIDQFIKANLEFNPFNFIKNEHNDLSYYTCHGIRTDGTFIISSQSRTTSKSYYEKKYFYDAMIFDEDIVSEKAKIDRIFETAKKEHNEKIAELIKKLIPIDISKYTNSK